MKNLLYLALLVPFILGSCNRHISSEIVTGVNVKQYKTYAWLPPAKETEPTIAEQNIRVFVNTEIEKRGYVLDVENPDVLLRSDLQINKRKAVVSEPVYGYSPFGFGRWGMGMYPMGFGSTYVAGYRARDVQFQEAAIIVDMIQRENHRHIWRGSSVEVLERSTLKPANLEREIERIFKKFPAKISKS